jgi:predicted esterase
MAQRNQYPPQTPSIDSALTESSPRPEHVNAYDDVDEGSGERRPILHDVGRPVSPSTSTRSSENAENSRSTTTQSVDFAPLRQDSTVYPTSEADPLVRDHGLPRSQSNRSSQVRRSYQPMLSMSSLEIDRALPENYPLQDLQELTYRQRHIPSHRRDDRPRIPTGGEIQDLPMAATIIPPKAKERIENIIIVLHDHSGNELSLREFAEQHLRPKDTACLLLRGVSPVAGKENSYQWEDNLDDFLRTSWLILNEVICDLLIKQCNFPAHKIILFGQGEGAKAALATFLTWETVKFGGVICVGGQLPSHFALPGNFKSKTAVLLLGGALGMTTPVAKNRIEQNFSYVDLDLIEGKDDALPRGNQLNTLRDFFAHRLHEEEWTKPAIITFGEAIPRL